MTDNWSKTAWVDMQYIYIHPSYFLCGINFYFNSTTTGGGLNWSNIEIACIRDPRVKCTVTSSCHKTALTWQRLVDRKDNQLRTWHLCLVDRVICHLISRKLCFQYTVSYIVCCLHTNLIYEGFRRNRLKYHKENLE